MKNHLMLLILMLPLMSKAQQSTNLWTGINVSKKITKKISAEADGQWRLTDNLTKTGSYIGELGVGYKFNKHLEINGFYRYINRRKYDKGDAEYVYKHYHRFYANLIYDRKIAFLKFEYRLRYQNQFKDDNGSFENDKSYLRNRLGVSFPTKTKFTPGISADLFYRLGETFDEIRYKADIGYKINKNNTITVGAFISNKLATSEVNDLTLLLTYKLKL